MPSTALAADTGMPKYRRQAKPLLRFTLPIKPGLSPRAVLEAQIELLVDLLDWMTPDADLEDNGDLEPACDDEPSLGSPEGALGMHWGAGGSSDLEKEVRISAKLKPHHAGLGVPYRGIRRWHEEQAATALDNRLSEIVKRRKHHASRNDVVTSDERVPA